MHPGLWELGLSPLARGTHKPRHQLQPRTRFIPAGAGNSPVASFPVVSSSVYPRWRGELYINEVNLWKLYGLSPLARGTLFMRGSKSPRRRFIPAGAGNSGESGCVHQWSSVYPRWRGELRNWSSVNRRRIGLSPLARGTRCAHRRQLFPVRFIPAGAGNSNTTANKHDVIRVYPRWRGELKTTGPDHLK